MILQFLSIAGAAVFMVFFFGLCIFVHELGHFLAARWRGMYVSAFSIGFRKVWAKKYKGVEYRIGCIPVGGYVEIPEIDSTDKEIRDDKGNLLKHASPLDRMIAVVAGPLFNFIFGFIIAAVIWVCGIPQDTPNMQEIEVASISPSGPEYKAGLRKGDRIIRLNGRELDLSWNGFVKEVITTIGPVKLTVRRDQKTFDLSYTPVPNKTVMPDEEIAYPFFMPRCPITIYPDKGSPAEKAGLRRGDRVLAVNGQPVTSLDSFELLIDTASGKPCTLLLDREGRETLIRNVLPEPTEVEGRKGEWMIGIRYTPEKEGRILVAGAVPGGPAEKAGLQKDDLILKINGIPANFSAFGQIVRTSDGKELKLTVLRKGKEQELTLKPFFKKYYTIGVRYAFIAHPSPWKQFVSVLDITWKSLRGLFVGLGNKLGMTEQTTTIKPRHMSGPIGIGRILYLSVYKGSLIEGLSLVVLLSFNLGLLNLLPIPVLDGGHVLLAFLELLFRRKITEKILQPVSYAFIAILIGFMIFVTYYDARRLIGGFRTPPSQESLRAMQDAETAEQKQEKTHVPAK